MGDDLEARLRTHAAATAWNPFGELCTEAADEVERLRAERDALLVAGTDLMCLLQEFMVHEALGRPLPTAERVHAVLARTLAAVRTTPRP
jgi:hypothetical protein